MKPDVSIRALCHSSQLSRGAGLVPRWLLSILLVGAAYLSSFATASAASTAVRDLPANYVPGVAFPVQIVVTPAAGSVTWAVVENVPLGWVVSTPVANGGTYVTNATQNKITWSIDGDTQTTLSYTVTPPSSASGQKTFSGIYNVDGTSVSPAITGDQTIDQSVTPTPTSKGSATRTLPATYTPGTGLTVTITTAPNGDATQTVVDAPPAGWTVTNIIGGGSFASGKVTWNIGNGTAQTLTYTAKPPSSDSGTKTWGASTYTGDGAANTIGGATSIAQSIASGGGSTVVRDLPASYVPGVPFSVQIVVTPVAGSVTWAVVENVPQGWVVSTPVADGGTYVSNPTQNKITWSIDGDTQTILSYTVTPPSSASGQKTFSGIYNVDGTSVSPAITGDQTINQSVTPTPTTKGSATRTLPSTYTPGTDLTVTITTAPNGDATQTVVDVPPAGWTVKDIINGGSFASGKVTWSIGNGTAQTLTYTATPPSSDSGTKTWGASTYTGDGAANTIGGANSIAQSIPSGGSSTVVRDLPATYVSGVPFTVQIVVTPVAGSVTWAVVENVPLGWVVSTPVANDGTYVTNATQNKITWSIDGDAPTTLSYTVTPPSSASGQKTFSGIYNVDGTSVSPAITGDQTIDQSGTPTFSPGGTQTRALQVVNTTVVEVQGAIAVAPNNDALSGGMAIEEVLPTPAGVTYIYNTTGVAPTTNNGPNWIVTITGTGAADSVVFDSVNKILKWSWIHSAIRTVRYVITPPSNYAGGTFTLQNMLNNGGTVPKQGRVSWSGINPVDQSIARNKFDIDGPLSVVIPATGEDPTPIVDLTISQSAPATATVGQPITYTLTVQMTGAGSANYYPKVRFNFPTGVAFTFNSTSSNSLYDSVLDATGVSFGGGVLSPGTTATLTVTVTPTAAGVLTSAGADVAVDTTDVVIETDETNNTAQTIQTTVSAPVTTTKGSATRTLPSTYTPGIPLTVTITTAPNGDATQEVVDAPPAGWSVTDISSGGSFASGKVNWSIGNGTAQTLTYTATPPSTDSGTKIWGVSTYTGDGFANTILGENSIAHGVVLTTKGSATRTLPSAYYTPGTGLTVTITTVPNGDATQTVVDAPPTGWTVTDISSGGGFSFGKVGWNIGNGTAQTLTYTATPPSTDSGTKTWGFSTYTGDGPANDILGASSIAQFTMSTTKGSATRLLPATYTPGMPLTVTITTAPNGDATQTVVDALPAGWTVTDISGGGSFASGKVSWSIGNGTAQTLTYTATPPSSDSGTRIWGVSTYTGDGASNTIGGANSIAQDTPSGGSSTAVRDLPANYVPGVAFPVQIVVTPAAGSVTWAVVENVPLGWVVSTPVANDGTYVTNATQNKITWSIDGDTQTTLSYTVTPPSSASGQKTFSGIYNVDGTSVSPAITGDQTIDESGTPTPTTKGSATRALPATYTPGTGLTVTITTAPNGDATQTVVDVPPAGWTVTDIIGGGSFASGKVSWSIGNGTAQTLTYTATPPSSDSGTKTWGVTSTYTGDGAANTIGGANSIAQGTMGTPAHPADTNIPPDFKISISEAVAYATAYQNKSAWPTTPTTVTISWAVNAATLYQNGQSYHEDLNATPGTPSRWVTGP